MKQYFLTFIVFGLAIISVNAATTYKVRNNPQTGEYATVTAALEVCADNAIDRDTIDVLGTFTESINVTKSVVIRGVGWNESVLQAFASAPVVTSPPATKGRVISIATAGKNVDIENLTVRYGFAAVTGGGILVDKINNAKVVLKKLKVSENYSETHSGGVALIGTNVDVIDCYIAGNRSKTVGGGGMHIQSNNSGSNSVVNVIGCTIANNLTDNTSGGGLSIDGNPQYGQTKLLEVNIINSTIAFNESGALGAGFFAKGTPYTGTPSANTNIKIWMNHCTIAYNKVTAFGTNSTGIGFTFADVATGNPVVDLHNTIITKNYVAVDATTNKNDVNFNRSVLDSVTNCIFGVTFINLSTVPTYLSNKTGKFDIVKLDTELRNRGSVVPVLPILAGSIAIDSIHTNYAPLAKDQRGKLRTAKSDVGAFEFYENETTDIKEYKYMNSKFNLVQNPVKNMLALSNPDEIKRVTIRNLNGMVIYDGEYGTGVNVMSLFAGVYVVHIQSVANEHVSQLFIKAKL